ncbi:ArsC family reductase [Pseudomaricurvus alkylphenolicus]|uniref:ArsC family reductase n=1 Tax=Pseudomaricurvus alkylphenolicus TaxID=1306991 RepID=UPI0014244A5F|nr:ArsC family reductase [Pseudomaricurvus alkylphenolicus]NIB39859.1 ArsC family reductase [Pseudomaricurvus alkylphenolicus]
MTTLYGISNCDTVKKARKWLEQQGVDYTFHDFRKDGIERQQVIDWVNALGWETLVNKRSTTWKGLDDATKNSLNDTSIIDIILDQPTLIKRPLLNNSGDLSVGFKAADYEQRFA